MQEQPKPVTTAGLGLQIPHLTSHRGTTPRESRRLTTTGGDIHVSGGDRFKDDALSGNQKSSSLEAAASFRACASNKQLQSLMPARGTG